MKTLQFIAALGLASLAWGNACTSAANGNWNATASWSNCGGGVPGSGDTVTITHNIIVTADATVGNSPSDALASAPATYVLVLQRTNGTTSNGQLTVNGGVTFSVQGSVSVTGTNGSYAPIITLEPGSTWTFDNSANPTAVYRINGTAPQALAYINAPGTGWAAGQYVTINGRPPSCSSCTGAIWTNEAASGIGGGTYDTFRQNYSYVKFWYFGSPTDTYRSAYHNCYDGDHQANQQMYMIHVEWHNSTGFAIGNSSGYPCSYMDYRVQFVKALDSTTSSTRGFFITKPVGSPTTGKNRILQYVYLDTGMDAGSVLTGFQTASYFVLDGQAQVFGPTSTFNPALFPNVDHMLVREVKGTSGTWAFGSTSYLLDVVDGGVGNQHSISTFSTTTGSYNWVMDHIIWQHGDAANSADSDPIEARPYSRDGFPTAWNYLLMLPNAAQPQYTSHASGAYQYTTSSTAVYNHSVWTFGKNYSGIGAQLGSLYIGETDCGVAHTIGFKNSILWNPNPSAGESATYALVSSCTPSSMAANAFDPTWIHHNLVYNYGTNSTRWSSSASACGGADCTSKGTPYDAPMTGTAPGASDIHDAPRFVWQTQGITAPGAREWAHIKHGADITTGETATEVHFATTFALFKNANIDDTSTSAGMKGLIDEMFAWIYGEWSSSNPALKAAADDGSDIGAAPVTILCPSAYPAADVSRCNGLAQADRPSDRGNSAYSAGSN
jgi:hypothetical protein